MSIEFRQAKNTVRATLRGASDENLLDILEAARAGDMPWMDDDRCLVGRLGMGAISRSCTSPSLVSEAFLDLDGRTWLKMMDEYVTLNRSVELTDPRRQRVLVAICKAELKRRSYEVDTTSEPIPTLVIPTAHRS